MNDDVTQILARMMGHYHAEKSGYKATYSARHIDATRLLVDVARGMKSVAAEISALRRDFTARVDSTDRRLDELYDLVRDTRAAVNRPS